MDKTSRVMRVAVVVCTLIGLSYTLYTEFQTEPVFKSRILSHRPSVPVVVLQRESHTEVPKEAEHINGRYLYIIVKENDDLYLFTKLEQLHPYDRNNDNMIDASDPLYQKLYIGQYDEKKHLLTYRPIDQTAIRAIQITKDSNHVKTIQIKALYANSHQLSTLYEDKIVLRKIVKDDLEHIVMKPVG